MPGVSDLATVNPELAAEWHPTKNDDLKPSDFLPNSSKKVWWLCSKCGYDWEANIGARNRGNGCPICDNKKIVTGYNDLATLDPELAKQWHPTKNGNVTPSMICPNSHRYAWWMCERCGEPWEAQVKSRHTGVGCPVCAGRKVLKGYNDLESKCPELAGEWDYERNGDAKPSDFTTGSNRNVWWVCKDCGHKWHTAIYDRAIAKTGCPQCSGDYKVSFGEKAVSFYLSQIVEVKENYKTPFLGRMELDVFVPSLNMGIEYDGRGWHKNSKYDDKKNARCQENGIDLIRIREDDKELPGSMNFHVGYEDTERLERALRTIVDIVARKAGVENTVDVDLKRDSGVILAKKYRSRKDNSLAAKRPDLVRQWHPTKNGGLSPDMIAFKSNKHVMWICERGHEWPATVASRVAGNRCPHCRKGM